MTKFPTGMPVDEFKQLYAYFTGGLASTISAKEAAEAAWWVLGYGLNSVLGSGVQAISADIRSMDGEQLRMALVRELEPVALAPEGAHAVMSINWLKLAQLLFQVLPTLFQ